LVSYNPNVTTDQTRPKTVRPTFSNVAIASAVTALSRTAMNSIKAEMTVLMAQSKIKGSTDFPLEIYNKVNSYFAAPVNLSSEVVEGVKVLITDAWKRSTHNPINAPKADISSSSNVLTPDMFLLVTTIIESNKTVLQALTAPTAKNNTTTNLTPEQFLKGLNAIASSIIQANKETSLTIIQANKEMVSTIVQNLPKLISQTVKAEIQSQPSNKSESNSSEDFYR
jgi:prophage DNA circulation protein